MIHTYQIYGVPISSSHAFSTPLLPSKANPRLHVEQSRVSIETEISEEFLYTERGRNGETDRVFRDSVRPGHAVVQFGTAAEFFVEPERIQYHLRDSSVGAAVELWILGTVFSLWNELRGIPALHAAAVDIEGAAVGVLATNKGGKSSLAAALMQKGCPLLTDDILMVSKEEGEVVGQPSYPQMRMWPDQAAHFLGAAAVEALPLVVSHLSKRRVAVGEGRDFGRFCEAACPVSTLFLPERRDDVDQVRVERLSSGEALIELIRHSFLANVVDALGLAPRRLPVLVALANQVRMYRLVYPDGVQHLSRVADAVADVVATGNRSEPIQRSKKASLCD